MKLARNTIAKTEIRELLEDSSVALSHSEIQSHLDNLCDRVTIYRVLERLIKEGVVHKIVNIDGVAKYASCSVAYEHNHIHFSCQKCKAVTCLEAVQPSFHLPKGYKVNEVSFTLSGLCPECS